ncbi:MAG: hypothetical protein ACRD29_08690 [Acidimicrobiales bacterium]
MRRVVVALTMALVAFMGVGCAAGGGSADEATTTTIAPITLPPPAGTELGEDISDEDVVEAALMAYWDMFFRVNDPPAVDDPAIAELATGPARDALLSIVSENQANGDSYRFPEGSVTSHEIEVLAIEEATAEFEDCWVDDGLVVDTATGEVRGGGTPVTRLLVGTMVLEAGRWKVFEYEPIDEVEGIDGCAA